MTARPPGPPRRFRDRADAGRWLAEAVAAVVEAPEGGPGLVLGLPRGGVVVAAEVARALRLPLDAAVVRKVGAPGNPELALGAVTADGTVLINESVVRADELTPDQVAERVAAAAGAAADDESRYRQGAPPPDLRGVEVVLVDDGAATGATVRACLVWARARGARRVVVALPVAPRETLGVLEREADAVVCVLRPLLFRAVGWSYDSFGPTDSDDVTALLARGRPPA